MGDKEPIFSLHIDFEDGSNPIIYFNQQLSKIASLLEEWCVNYILTPAKDCKLADNIWYWHAKLRNDVGMSWPEFKESEGMETQTDANWEPWDSYYKVTV